MILSGDSLISLLKSKPPLVEGVDKSQIQPNGIDIRIDTVFKFESAGEIGIKESQIAGVSEIAPDSGGWFFLMPGAYRVRLMEVVHIPLGISAIARPRSTLTRCGASVHTALWDSGYEGRSEVLLTVYNPSGLRIQRGARIIQLVFFLCEGRVRSGYDGRYQGENV